MYYLVQCESERMDMAGRTRCGVCMDVLYLTYMDSMEKRVVHDSVFPYSSAFSTLQEVFEDDQYIPVRVEYSGLIHSR